MSYKIHTTEEKRIQLYLVFMHDNYIILLILLYLPQYVKRSQKCTYLETE